MKTKALLSIALLVVLALALSGSVTAQQSGTPLRSLDREGVQRSLTAAQGQNVELVGQIGGATQAVAVKGDYAYIGVGPRLVVLDISDPAHPTLVGRTGVLAGVVEDVAVADGYAYVVNYWAGLRIVDVSDPAHPTEVGLYDTPGDAGGVVVAGAHAYVADGSGGLRIVDVSDPAHPVEVGFYDTPGVAVGVAVSGSYAYVADGDAGLRVIDVSSPAHPVEVGFYDTPGYAEGVAVSGSYAYVADGDAGLRVIDVSDPASSREVGFYDTPGNAWSVAVSGGYAYVADGLAGLRIIDVSDPAHPVEVGLYDTPGDAWDVAVSGGYAYVADGDTGLRVIDVSDPASPREVGFYYYTSGGAVGVAVSGGYAYVADGLAGLRIIDVLDPASPREVGFYDTPGSAQGVAVAGSYVYVADGLAGLRIIDVSDPVHPVEVGFYDTPGGALGVAVAGSYAYVADWEHLRVIDVSSPAHPVEVGFYDTPGFAKGVAVAGGYAYVADGRWDDGGLRVIDISDPAHPVEVGFYNTPWYAEGVAVAGSYAYVADGLAGLRVIDVSDPAHPVEVGFYNTPGYAEGVAVSGGYAYMADGKGGLRVIDVSGPASPWEVGFYDTPGYAEGVAVAGSYAYVADSDGGLVILRFLGATTYVISGRVTDANGDPLAGVTIADDAGHTTTTNGDGRYTLSGLAERTYTVTPAKEGFTFSPASRTVSVPPDATGVDFVGRSTLIVDPMKSTLYSQPDSVPADGASRASIVVQLLNAAGQPVPGKTVWLESSRGVLDLVEEPLLATDNNGRVVGSVRSTAPGTATIFATVLDDGIRLSRSTVVTFTTYAPPSGTFLHSIDRIVNVATDSLDYIKGDAQEIAEHGAYFRGEIGANAAQLAADFVFGMADVLGGLSQSGNLENLKLAFRLKCPGCYIPGTWNTQFANTHPRVYRLFELSFAKLGGAPPEELTELLGWGGLKFFTGELAGYSAKSLSKSIAKDQLRKHLFGVNDGTQTLLYPTVERTAEELKDLLRERRSQLLANLPGMSEAEQKTYEADLRLRTGALILLGQRLRYPRLTLTDLRRAHSERSNALANFVWRTSAKLLASYFLDGAGLVALGGSRTLLDTYVNAKNLGESVQMYNLAVSTLAGSPDILQQIHETASRGLLQILLRQDPNPATGRVQRIVHRSEGTGWGPFWNETDSWSEVHLENTSSNEVTFYVTARYMVDTSRFGLPWATIFTQEEATINLKPEATGVVRLNYKKDSGATGISPVQGSDIEFVILGANDRGLYFVDSVLSSWNPTRLSSSRVAAGSAEQEAMPIDPPLSTYILPVPWRQQHEAQLWINNPFTSTVSVTVTQTLPAGIELLDAGGAIQSGSSITWYTVVNPTAMKVLTFTFGFPGAPGTEKMLPPATLSLVNPLDGQALTADSNAVAFQALWPFALDYALPRAVLPGEEIPVVVTVTNWLEEDPVSGSLTIRVLDTLSNTIYTNSQPFEVPNGSEATVLFALPGTLAKGNYVVHGQVNAQGTSHEAFADLVQVGLYGPNLNYEVTPLGVVRPGDFLTYTLSFTNSLGFPLNNTVLTTSIPAGVTVLPQSITDGGTIESGQVRWMLGTIENGERVERSFVVKVNTEVVSSTKRLYLTSEPRLTADEIAPVLGITVLNTVIVPENSTQNVIYLPVVQTLYPNPREQHTESLKSLEWRIYLPLAGR